MPSQDITFRSSFLFMGIDNREPFAICQPMHVLVACEFSGRVRQAFRDRGHAAWSCDLLPAEDGSPFHFQRDVRDILPQAQWDLVIAHPPCTLLCRAGARWWARTPLPIHQAAIDFFLMFTRLDCKWVIENPIGRMSHWYRKPDQVVQPWQHGEGEVKSTCLWLNKLDLLRPSKIVEGRKTRVHSMGESKGRSKERSRTYQGIANAMADQWG